MRNDSSLRYYDLKSKRQEKVHLDGMPYTCKYLADGTLLVSVWSSSKILAFNGAKLLFEVPTGDHPTEIEVDRKSRHAYVANANENSVTVIDTATNNITATIPFPTYAGEIFFRNFLRRKI